MAPSSRPAADASASSSGATGLWQTFVASSAVLVLGLAGLWQATAHGNAFTTETLRRTEVEQAPRELPSLRVIDAAGHPAVLPDMLGGTDRVWIVDFVYTRCQTICSALGGVFQQLQQQILDRGLADRVGLLSVSFDPAHDSPAVLREYAQRNRMDARAWRLVTLESPADRRALLDAFGIMVIPAPLGEWEHNAALHVISGGRLLRIVDYAQANLVLDLALADKP